MQTAQTVTQLRGAINAWRRQGHSVGLVPTMGNLHAGHIKLVEEARARAERVVVSIFVNPSQFGPGEDFDNYPRTPEQDAARLAEAGVDLLFLPAAAEIYPPVGRPTTFVEVPGLSDELCGHFRPGHFRGVATVVCKLFQLVQPDIALFGEKDYQQLAVIRRMVADLNLPVAVHGVATVREADGLALSSRNGYLSAEDRLLAPRLYRVLRDTAGLLQNGRHDFAAVEQEQSELLRSQGFQPDYLSIRRAADLSPPEAGDTDLVILAAAYLGKARLIDNLRVNLAPR